MSGAAAIGKRKKRTALSQLAPHLTGPKQRDELQHLLYPTEGRVDYDKLKELLKKAGGEANPGKLSKSQVTRLIERKLHDKKLTMNQILKALGQPERDDTEEEEEEEDEDDEDDEEEEEDEAAAPDKKKAPAKKKAKKTTPEPQEKRASGFLGGLVHAILSPVASIFSPNKKR